jgi:hypothetical protein
MKGFNITYDIVIEGSAECENGEPSECGFISQDARLRDAVTDLYDLDGPGNVQSAEQCDHTIRVFFEPDLRTPTRHETRTIHIPLTASAASCERLARLLGAHTF